MHATRPQLQFVIRGSRGWQRAFALDLPANVLDEASHGWLIWLDNDTDLDPRRGNPRFIGLVPKAKARFAA